MLKFFIYIIIIAALIGAAVGGWHLHRVAQKNAEEMAQYEGKNITPRPLNGKTLVVYYSLSGYTKDIAQRIQSMTQADIYEIKTAEKIDTTPWFYLTLKKQLADGNYPALNGNMPDFSQYDTIFVGGPVWWYTVSTPMRAFLQKADFMGKKVVPFSTQGSNFGTYFEDFAQMAKNAKLQRSASFNNLPAKYNQAVNNKIASWLNNL